jgi:multicomponent Na+:H+ antiporter subunit D
MRIMHATVPAGALVLAPALVVLLGLAILGTLDSLRVGWHAARLAALVALGLALGAALRLWLLARVAPLTLSLAPLPGSESASIGWYVDNQAGLGVVALLAAGLGATRPVDGAWPIRRAALALLMLVVAITLLLTTSVAVVAGLWLLLVLIGTIELTIDRQIASALAWASLALGIAPLLTFVGAFLASAHAGVALLTAAPSAANQTAAVLLTIAGLASAGLTPLNGWLAHPDSSPIAGLIADAALPLAGFSLAVRARGLIDPGHAAALVVLLVGFGLWSTLDANQALWKARGFPEVVREAARGETALAFIALSIGSSAALAAASFLLTFSVIARTSSRLVARTWLARLGWASAAGLPPLPGFVGRWLGITAALAAGQWLLALVLGAAGFVLNLGLFGTRSIRDENGSPPTTVDVLLAGLLVAAGLAPARVAIAVVAGQPGLVGAAEPVVAILVSMIVVLVPTAVALTVDRPRRPLTGATIERRVQDRSWSRLEQLAGSCAERWRVVDGRYDLPIGFLTVVVAVFTLMR